MRDRMKIILLLSCLVAGCAAAPQSKVVAQLPPPVVASQRTVDIELTDTSPNGSKTERYSLAVVDDRGWSKVATNGEGERMQVRARADRYRNDGPAFVSVELERDVQGQPKIYLEQSTIFFAGRRTVLGHLERASGGATDVAMVTR